MLLTHLVMFSVAAILLACAPTPVRAWMVIKCTLMTSVVLFLVCTATPVCGWMGGHYDYPERIPGTDLYIGNVYSTYDCDVLSLDNITQIVDLYGHGKGCEGVKRIVIPVYDTEGQDIMPTAEKVRLLIETSDHQRTLVHCQAGISRSATVLAYILMKSHDKTFEEALQTIRSVRNVVNPNSGFLEQLCAYGAWRDICRHYMLTGSELCAPSVLPWTLPKELDIEPVGGGGLRWWIPLEAIYDTHHANRCWAEKPERSGPACTMVRNAHYLGLAVRVALEHYFAYKDEL